MLVNKLINSVKLYIKPVYSTVCNYNYILYSHIHSIQNIVNDEEDELAKRLLRVTIIGLPNTGKSTLINNLMDRKVCPTSNKVHTTRKKNNAIFTERNKQIVFLDTPGIISLSEQKKYKLEKSFLKDCHSSLMQTDIIGVVHDISNIWTREKLDNKIIKLLEKYQQKPSFLILNKIDVLKSKRKLLDITKYLTNSHLNSIPYGKPDSDKKDNEIRGWPYFNEVFMVSGLFGDGISDIKNYLLDRAKVAPWMYPETDWTDQSSQELIVKTVQATLLDFLPQEIPYKLKTEMEFMDITDEGSLKSVILVTCPSERIRKLVVGVGDGKLRQITEKCQRDLMNTFCNHVSLRIVVVSNELEKAENK